MNAAVARASATPTVVGLGTRVGNVARLTWRAHGVTSFRVLVGVDGGSSRALGAATTATTASVPLAAHHSYVITVAGLGPDGSRVATSTPYRVARR